MFEAAELRRVLDYARPGMAAMILLAANGGLGNADVADLPIEAVNLETGWLEFPRPKTGIPRRIPLWPEPPQARTSGSEVGLAWRRAAPAVKSTSPCCVR